MNYFFHPYVFTPCILLNFCELLFTQIWNTRKSYHYTAKSSLHFAISATWFAPLLVYQAGSLPLLGCAILRKVPSCSFIRHIFSLLVQLFLLKIPPCSFIMPCSFIRQVRVHSLILNLFLHIPTRPNTYVIKYMLTLACLIVVWERLLILRENSCQDTLIRHRTLIIL